MLKIQSDRETEEFVRRLRRRLRNALSALLITVLASTLGFMLLSDQEGVAWSDRIMPALWNTLNLVSTVGFLEQELNVWQRLWALAVIIIGLGAVLYGFSTMQGLLLGGDVRRLYARRKMQRTLESIENHIMICGYGHVGREVAEEIHRAGHPLVVLDLDEQAAGEADEAGHLVVHADCTKEESLRLAGIDRASGLIATLDSDATNVYLMLIARELKPHLRIVTRSERGETRSTLLRAGANRVIVPGELAGQQLSQLVLKPRVSEFIAAARGEGEYEFVEVEVSNQPKLLGRSLRDLDLTKRVAAIVIAIIDHDGQQTFNPPADSVLEKGDTLIVVCQQGGLQRIAELGA